MNFNTEPFYYKEVWGERERLHIHVCHGFRRADIKAQEYKEWNAQESTKKQKQIKNRKIAIETQHSTDKTKHTQ